MLLAVRPETCKSDFHDDSMFRESRIRGHVWKFNCCLIPTWLGYSRNYQIIYNSEVASATANIAFALGFAAQLLYDISSVYCTGYLRDGVPCKVEEFIVSTVQTLGSNTTVSENYTGRHIKSGKVGQVSLSPISKSPRVDQNDYTYIIVSNFQRRINVGWWFRNRRDLLPKMSWYFMLSTIRSRGACFRVVEEFLIEHFPSDAYVIYDSDTRICTTASR